jgi:hypothetical protein
MGPGPAKKRRSLSSRQTKQAKKTAGSVTAIERQKRSKNGSRPYISLLSQYQSARHWLTIKGSWEEEEEKKKKKKKKKKA